MLRRYALIAVGGACGASLRWGIDEVLQKSSFHWAIFMVNVLGCFILGLLLARKWLQDAGAIGFCGGLTTMSTFSQDVARQLETHQYATAVLYLSANVIVGFAALLAGAALSNRITAAGNPVEEAP